MTKTGPVNNTLLMHICRLSLCKSSFCMRKELPTPNLNRRLHAKKRFEIEVPINHLTDRFSAQCTNAFVVLVKKTKTWRLSSTLCGIFPMEFVFLLLLSALLDG